MPYPDKNLGVIICLIDLSLRRMPILSNSSVLKDSYGPRNAKKKLFRKSNDKFPLLNCKNSPKLLQTTKSCNKFTIQWRLVCRLLNRQNYSTVCHRIKRKITQRPHKSQQKFNNLHWIHVRLFIIESFISNFFSHRMR